ncbi:MAG: tetratricopeptide repeat protein [Dehalococcoidia bacterium]
MERAQESTALRSAATPLSWRVTGQYIPVLALLLGVFLIVRNLAGDGASTPSPATVDPGYYERLNENIAFFEGRVVETNDSLSYNRLTQLYLQRQRTTGDVSDIARAEISATRSLEAAPGAYPGLVNMGYVRLAQHDFDAALTAANDAVARLPREFDAYAVRGDALLALGRYDEAGDDYRLLLEKAPGPAAYARNASIAEVYGNTDIAAQFWQAAIDSDSQDAPEASAWARVQLANLLFNTGELGDAEREFETALRVFPGYGAAEAGLGHFAAAKGDDGEAIERYERAVGALPIPEYVAAFGDVLARDGQTAQAEQQFALLRAMGQLYEANGVRNDLTVILFELDHGGEAGGLVERARLAYEERPSLAAADTYGWALYRAGRLDEARAKADEALRLGTKDPLYLFHAAVVADAQGDTAAARGLLERLNELNAAFSVRHSEWVAELTVKAGLE